MPERNLCSIGDRRHFLRQYRAPDFQGAETGLAELANALRFHAYLGEEIEVERYRLADLLRPFFPDLAPPDLRVPGFGDEGMDFHCGCTCLTWENGAARTRTCGEGIRSCD
ncbi:hypothetical protein D3C80_1747490 [compost metagenome]